MLPSAYIISSQFLDVSHQHVTSIDPGDRFEGILGRSKVYIKDFYVPRAGSPTARTQVRCPFIAFLIQLPARSIGPLPGNCGVEAPGTQECRPTPWCHTPSPPAYF